MRRIERTAIICELENDLMQYRKVLVFLPSCGRELISRFLESSVYIKQCSGIKVYTPEGVSDVEKDGVRVVSEQELDEMLGIYWLYEFTDNIQVIGESQNYAGLLNYVRTGVLTEQEFFEAVLS